MADNSRDSVPRGWPPEMEPVIAAWQRGRWAIIGVLLLVLLVWLMTSFFYTVQADSEGVLLRFGKYSRTTEPGLHWKFPWPIEQVYLVPVDQIQSLEFGFSTARPGRRTQYAPTSKDHIEMARMLSADLNLCHVEWIVQYKIFSPQ
ncbi:MAG: SPFH domain-containing protein, partial [Planctomycetota bacterium]